MEIVIELCNGFRSIFTTGNCNIIWNGFKLITLLVELGMDLEGITLLAVFMIVVVLPVLFLIGTSTVGNGRIFKDGVEITSFTVEVAKGISLVIEDKGNGFVLYVIVLDGGISVTEKFFEETIFVEMVLLGGGAFVVLLGGDVFTVLLGGGAFDGILGGDVFTVLLGGGAFVVVVVVFNIFRPFEVKVVILLILFSIGTPAVGNGRIFKDEKVIVFSFV